MSRIIAIDYGRRRTGIAATDPLQISVNALGTFAPSEAAAFLQTYLQSERVEAIVVGKPLKMDGTPAQAAAGAAEFARRLRRMFPEVRVESYDERCTSRMAMQALIAGGATLRQRRCKPLTDQISACIILQSYLDYVQNLRQRQGFECAVPT